MKYIQLSFLSFLVFFGSHRLFSQEAVFSAQKLQKHIDYLASEELAGRKAGSEGDSLAAIYIRDRFAEAGAELIYPRGFQYFSLVADVKAGDNNSFVANGKPFVAGQDFQPFSFSASAKSTGQVVFAGFGLVGSSGEMQWDDFATVDVRGKWVLALRGDPEPDNPNSGFIPVSSDRAKAMAVRDRGVAGLLLVSPSSIDRSDHPVDISFDKSVSDAGIPVVSVTRKLSAALIGLPVTAIDSLEKVMIAELRSVAFDTKSSVSVVTDVVRKKVVSRNIVAVLPGSDPALKDEYIVIGAHYDHLGMGGPGSGSRMIDTVAVHAGADDNASGVASLIELANWFGKNKIRHKRSLMFISFGAEEMGLLGSRHFVANLPVKAESIKAMVNMDMIGRLKTDQPVVTISGTGTFTVADSLLNLHTDNRPFEIIRSPDGYGPSDHAAFYSEGIPVLYFTTGAHADYHTPLDLPDRINIEGQKAVTELVAVVSKELTSLTPGPVFRESGSRTQTSRYSRNLKVTLGIMPDVSGAETSGGMKVEGVKKDGPAARAGMVKGDIIVAINGLEVANVYDYMGRMSKLKPGETVNIEVLRNGKREVLIVQL